jgi:hypothetical protein
MSPLRGLETSRRVPSPGVSPLAIHLSPLRGGDVGTGKGCWDRDEAFDDPRRGRGYRQGVLGSRRGFRRSVAGTWYRQGVLGSRRGFRRSAAGTWIQARGAGIATRLSTIRGGDLDTGKGCWDRDEAFGDPRRGLGYPASAEPPLGCDIRWTACFPLGQRIRFQLGDETKPRSRVMTERATSLAVHPLPSPTGYQLRVGAQWERGD